MNGFGRYDKVDWYFGRRTCYRYNWTSCYFEEKKDRELKKQAGGDDNFGSQSDFSMSDDEKKAKEYIEQYKSSYPKESIKAGLINFGISDSDAENYINKYM